MSRTEVLLFPSVFSGVHEAWCGSWRISVFSWSASLHFSSCLNKVKGWDVIRLAFASGAGFGWRALLCRRLVSGQVPGHAVRWYPLPIRAPAAFLKPPPLVRTLSRNAPLRGSWGFLLWVFTAPLFGSSYWYLAGGVFGAGRARIIIVWICIEFVASSNALTNPKKATAAL